VQANTHDMSLLFIELGAAIGGLGLLARLASHWGFSSVPLYLLAGLALGNGGLLPLHLSEQFIHIGGEIGVLLLLFMLGLEYTGEELKEHLHRGLPVGAFDFLFNFLPGLAAAKIFGWSWFAALVLGGVTWVSSSGVIAKVLGELRRLENPETPTILTVLVLEDLAMAVYLPLVAALAAAAGGIQLALSVATSLAVVTAALFAAVAMAGSSASG
jgi:monovalent cation:H+ antiporter-2, CPA2 family